MPQATEEYHAPHGHDKDRTREEDCAVTIPLRPTSRHPLTTQQVPSLPIGRILMPLAIRREMQRAIRPPHQRKRNDVPGINRNQINRKKVHHPARIPLPLRPHHIQAITIPGRRAIYSSVILGIPPSPLIFWNLGMRARPPPKSLRNKDLYAKYSRQRT